MGTRARIGIQLPSGAIKSIYTHWDGYPEHHAVILNKHYKSLKLARELIKLGDLSTMGETIGEQHGFEQHAPEGAPSWCTSYTRDRGETGCAAKRAPGLDSLVRQAWNCDAEFIYIFAHGDWVYMATPRSMPKPGDSRTWDSCSNVKEVA
jgi:hypothetical protein